MPLRKLSLLTATLATAALLLAGCSSGQPAAVNAESQAPPSSVEELYAGTYGEPPESAPEAAVDQDIWIVTCGQIAAGCAIPGQSAIEAAESLGWTGQICDGELNPASWSQCVRQGVAAKADAIITVGIDCPPIQQALQEAGDADVPVIGVFGTDCDDPSFGGEALFASVVVPSADVPDYPAFNRTLGQARAAWIIADSGGEADILELKFEGNSTGDSNHAGFADEIKTCAGCKVTPIPVTNDSMGNLRQTVESALLKNPSADYFVIPLDALTLLGASQAIATSGRAAELTVVGAEGTAPVMDLLRADQGVDVVFGIAGDWWGYAGIDTVLRTLAGEDAVPQGLAYQAVDKSNNLPAEGGYVPPVDFEAAYLKAWGVS